MVTTAELGLDLLEGRGRLPLDEDAVRATYSRFELHVPTAIRALTLREPTRTVDRALRRPALDGRAATEARSAAQAGAGTGGPGVRAGGAVLRRLSA